MKNQHSPITQQVSPKAAITLMMQKKQQNQNQQFNEFLQKNQSLVQILEQQSQRCYDYPKVNLDKFRSNSSYRSLKITDLNTTQNTKKNLNPSDIIKLKDILNTDKRSKKIIDSYAIQKTSPKLNNSFLNEIIFVNNQKQSLLHQDKKQENNVQERQLKLPFSNIIAEQQKENVEVETPRFFGMV